MSLSVNSRLMVPSDATANMKVVYKKDEKVMLQDTKGVQAVVHESQIAVSGTNAQNVALRAIDKLNEIQDPPEKARDLTLKVMREEDLREDIEANEMSIRAGMGSGYANSDKAIDKEARKTENQLADVTVTGTTSDYLAVKLVQDLKEQENPARHGLKVYKNLAVQS